MPRPGRLPRLMAHQREPALDIHPGDAARLDLKDGGLARVESPHGSSILPARLSEMQRKDEVFASFHWTDRFTSAGPIDVIVGAATGPITGPAELKAAASPISAGCRRWSRLPVRGFQNRPPGPYYWSRAPLERGH